MQGLCRLMAISIRWSCAVASPVVGYFATGSFAAWTSLPMNRNRSRELQVVWSRMMGRFAISRARHS